MAPPVKKDAALMPPADREADAKKPPSHVSPYQGHAATNSTSELDPAPGPSLEERMEAVRAAQEAGGDGLIEAAGGLLRALAEMPQELDESQVKAWCDLLHAEVSQFTLVCEHAGVRREHMLAARYVLCTALDEAAGRARWNRSSTDEGRDETAGPWSQKALLPAFHSEVNGGEKVFMLLGRMAHAPQEHRSVLELLHHVLSLGFVGSYHGEAQGPRELEMIRQRLFTLAAQGREAPARELSPQWRGAVRGRFKLLRAVPVWASASLLGLVLFGQFAWAKYQLLSTSGDVERRIHALRQLQPPHQSTPELGLAKLLAPEIAAGRVTVEEAAGRSRIVFKGDGMFASGQGSLSSAAAGTLQKVGQALKAVPGRVVVTGHTDNLPSPDPLGLNAQLSLARARSVTQALVAQGVPRDRILAEGKGAEAPVADNDSPTGRARNRRVEIQVQTAQR